VRESIRWLENESQKLDYMGRILAIGKGADEDRNGCTVSEALGSDSARRRRRRKNGLHRATLEDMGRISTLGKGGCNSSFALGVGCWGVGKSGSEHDLIHFFGDSVRQHSGQII
jgi:hypothetical protein